MGMSGVGGIPERTLKNTAQARVQPVQVPALSQSLPLGLHASEHSDEKTLRYEYIEHSLRAQAYLLETFKC